MFASILRFVVGIVLTTLSVVLIVSRLAIEVIGASTAPDDFEALRQRMPNVANWLFTTPWWVPSLLMLALAAAGGYLLWSATRKTASEGVADSLITEERVKALVDTALAEAPKPVFKQQQVDLGEIENKINEANRKIGVLAAAERARVDLDKVIRWKDRAIETPDIVPARFTEQGYARLYDKYGHADRLREQLVGNGAYDRFDAFLNTALEKVSADPLNFIVEDHEKEKYGTNAGKKAYVIAQTRLTAAREFFQQEQYRLEGIIRAAAELQP